MAGDYIIALDGKAVADRSSFQKFLLEGSRQGGHPEGKARQSVCRSHGPPWALPRSPWNALIRTFVGRL